VQSDADFSTDLQDLKQDVAEANNDLAMTRADGAHGQGDDCDNLEAVDSDAADAVTADQQDAAEADLNSLTADLASANDDIQAVNQALTAVQQDGNEPPPGATDAIAAVRSAEDLAKSTANAEIQAVNADVTSAYAVADSLATGSCAGDGPGEPPGPLATLS
jgi:hypothetical protein